MSHAIVVDGLRFAWPNGDIVFDGLSFAVSAGRTGLVGSNGSGKTTLLRLIAGELAPARGSIHLTGRIDYVRQDLSLDPNLGIDEVLGIAEGRRALHAIEAGEVTQEHLVAVGDDWDIEERAHGMLDRLGLGHIDLDRKVGAVSGGEAVLLGLAARLLRRPDVLLLDEPTNNLDLSARRRLYDAVANSPAVILLVSHDRRLLELVDNVAELRDGSMRFHGGSVDAYEAAIAAEQETAARLLRDAASDVRRQERELVQARIKLDRRRRYGRKMWETKREPKIIMGARKRQAEVAAGKHRTLHIERLSEARARLAAADDAIWEDEEIRIDLPDTVVPEGRTVLKVCDARLRGGVRVDLEVRGPERIALLGANGAGKTTLLETIVGRQAPSAGTVVTYVPLRYLPQRLDLLDGELSVAANVHRFAPSVSENHVRAALAKFGFGGPRADQIVRTLSGGERFRASLAALMLAGPVPQLLLLDEPSNNLDMTSVRALTEALTSYRGAILVASHDLPFVHRLNVTRWLRLDGQLSEIEAQGSP